MLAVRTDKKIPGSRTRSTAIAALAILIPALGGLVDAGRAAHRTLIVAHRGGAAESTENTIGAFQRAVRLGADGIETDIRLTRDGVVVVYHDDYFGRVEGLAPAQRTRLISDMTYDDLTRQTLIPVGEDTGGRKVPTLLELLSEVRHGLLNIEIKRCARFDEMIRQTTAVLKGFPDLDRVVLESPDLETAKKLRKAMGSRLKLHINPEYDGTVPLSESLKRVLKFKPHSISVSYRKVSREIVDQAHRAGVEVWVWTVNTEDTAQEMAALGVDAIKTDKPSLLMKVVGNHN
jgi:glycerophosphoryl diester phosphodiesterase